jgi:hypothetical protein
MRIANPDVQLTSLHILSFHGTPHAAFILALFCGALTNKYYFGSQYLSYFSLKINYPTTQIYKTESAKITGKKKCSVR